MKPRDKHLANGVTAVKYAFLKSMLLDSFLIFYCVISVKRIIWQKFFLELQDVPFHWSEAAYLFAVSVACGIVWTYSGTSIGARLSGISRSGKAAKYCVEVSGWMIFNITFAAGWIVTRVSVAGMLSSDGVAGANRIFGALLRPELSIFDGALFAVIETIYIALLATLLSIPPALAVSFLTARNLMSGSRSGMAVYYALRFILNFIRSVEPLIWAIVFSVWVGIGAFAGMVALLVHTVASSAKLYSEAIEGIEPGPVEAVSATGANKIQTVWFGVVPQIVLPFLSFTIYRWDINVRMATVIGLVGGGGIGTMLMQYQGLAKWNEVGLIVMMIAVVVWVMDYISAKIREAIY